MDTMPLYHVGMWSNNNVHAKGLQVFGYMKLIRKWFTENFFTPVHKHNYNVDVSLGEDKIYYFDVYIQAPVIW